MSHRYSQQQLLKAQSKFQLAADMLELAQSVDEEETLETIGEAIGAGEKAFDELDISSQSER